MANLVCPACDAVGEPAAVAGAVEICANCGATIAIDDQGPRLAVFEDVKSLSDVETKRLKRARGAIVRPDRRQR